MATYCGCAIYGKKSGGKIRNPLHFTDQFHNELVDDLIPAVEGKCSTYATDTIRQKNSLFSPLLE